jgi:dephospho-CoA kinase
MRIDPIKVGVTGGIGSGKSTVSKIFSILGIPIYSADDRAKWLMIEDSVLKEKIISAFGKESYLESGQLNRTFLAKTVFSDPKKVKQINGLVHPAVKDDFNSWVNTQSSPYVLKEAALIFETGGQNLLDYVINVSAPLRIRVSRVMMRDPDRSEAQINQIIDQQLPDEEKNELSDFVIKNVDNKLLLPQILKIHEKLVGLAS